MRVRELGRAEPVKAARRDGQRLGARTRVERTENMPSMVVTPEVSQLEISALKFAKPWKSWYISEMIETFQLAMGPNVAVASVGLTLNVWTAVFREAILVKA